MGTKLTLGDGGWIIDRSSRARSHRLANDPHDPRLGWWTIEIGLGWSLSVVQQGGNNGRSNQLESVRRLF